MSRIGLLLAALALLGAACAPRTSSEKIAAWRGSAVSPRTWERVRPHLEALEPGDDLRLFEASRQVYRLGRRKRGRPVVVMPAWITSLSGGATGGASMLGQLVSRRGDRVYGSHVFGFVRGSRIVPRYQLLTTATVIDAATFQKLEADRERGIGALHRPDGTIHFRDLYVAGGRRLEFSDPGDAAPAEHDVAEPDAAAFFSEASYRRASPVLDSLPVGTDLFSMLWLLGAEFVSSDFGESHSLRAPGFLNYKQIRTLTFEAADGIFKLRPFGWVEGDVEVVKRVAVFQNDRLRGVVPYTGFVDVVSYIEATAPADTAQHGGALDAPAE